MKEVGVGLDEGRRRSHAVGLSQAAKIMLAPNGAEAMATAIKSQPTRHLLQLLQRWHPGLALPRQTDVICSPGLFVIRSSICFTITRRLISFDFNAKLDFLHPHTWNQAHMISRRVYHCTGELHTSIRLCFLCFSTINGVYNFNRSFPSRAASHLPEYLPR